MFASPESPFPVKTIFASSDPKVTYSETTWMSENTLSRVEVFRTTLELKFNFGSGVEPEELSMSSHFIFSAVAVFDPNY